MNHPNAAAAGTSSGLTVLVVWLLSLAGVDVSPEVAAALAGAVATVVLLIGRDGIGGVARIVWRGRSR